MFPISDARTSGKLPLITIGLIIANVYIFFLQLTSPDAFMLAYSLVPSHVNFANYHTLIPFITSMFLHGGFLHIASNMWFLWIFGDNVEAQIGKIPYLFLYIASGIIGGFAQYLLMSGSTIPTLGASGAIAGVLGAYFRFFPHNRIKTLVPIGFVFVTEVPAILMLGYWFVLQLVSGVGSLGIAEAGGVAFFAHVGGFVAGYVLALFFRPEGETRTQNNSWA